MTCAKQTVKALIITPSGEKFEGTNACENPQEECPRDVQGYATGEGYHLCKEVCNQQSHAEVAAIKNAGSKAKGSKLYLTGHSYACSNCKAAAKKAGIIEIVIHPYDSLIGENK